MDKRLQLIMIGLEIAVDSPSLSIPFIILYQRSPADSKTCLKEIRFASTSIES